MLPAALSPSESTDTARQLLSEAITLQATLRRLIAETSELIEKTKQLMKELQADSLPRGADADEPLVAVRARRLDAF